MTTRSALHHISVTNFGRFWLLLPTAYMYMYVHVHTCTMQFLCRLIASQVRQTSGTIWHLLSIPEEQFRQHTLQEQITHVRTFPTTARISHFKPLQGINKYVWSTQMVNISTCMNVCFRKGGTGKEHSQPWNIRFHIPKSRKRVSMGGAPFMITNRTDRDFL